MAEPEGAGAEANGGAGTGATGAEKRRKAAELLVAPAAVEPAVVPRRPVVRPRAPVRVEDWAPRPVPAAGDGLAVGVGAGAATGVGAGVDAGVELAGVGAGVEVVGVGVGVALAALCEEALSRWTLLFDWLLLWLLWLRLTRPSPEPLALLF